MSIFSKTNLLKAALLSTAIVTAAVSASAVAQEYEGAYGGLAAGLNTNQDSGVFGGILGYRATVGDNGSLVLGVEAEVDYYSAYEGFSYGASAIAGLKTGDRGLMFAKFGYSKLDSDSNYDGISLGAGYEFGVNDNLSLRVGYDFNIHQELSPVDGHEFKVAAIFNF